MEDEKILDVPSGTEIEEESVISEVPEENQEEKETGNDEDKDVVIAKLKEERDNYKRGLIELKSGNKKPAKQKQPAGSVEAAVAKAMSQMAQKDAKSDVLDPESPHYIPELTSSSNWNQIIGYIPRSADMTTRSGVRKALKMATVAWKAINGINEADRSGSDASADAASSSGKSSISADADPKKRTMFSKREEFSDWYKKK